MEANTPASKVIEKFGSARRLARLLSERKGKTVHASTVARWNHPREKRGSDGLIPAWHHKDILALAAEYHIDLEKADLVG